MRLTRAARLLAGVVTLVLTTTLVAPAAQAGPKDRKRTVDRSISQLRRHVEMLEEAARLGASRPN